MKEKLYLVMTYDDYDKEYTVIGAYSTKRKAERIAAEIPISQIDEYSLDEGFDELEAGLNPWRICVFEDGRIVPPQKRSLNEIFGTKGDIDQTPFHINLSATKFWLTVWARNEEHARELSEALLKKVLRERESREHE